MLYSILFSAGLLFSGLQHGSDEPVLDSLHAVTVTADKGVTVSRSDTLMVSNAFSVTDVLLQSPGLYIGDYGGISGLKTVSLRGLGSAHTSVYIDGVRVANVQSGQNDLGMIGADNLESVTVDYAQNSISFNTARPVFAKRSVIGAVRLSAGSFGSWLPSARMGFRLTEKMSLSANASGVITKGNFGYGDGLVRENNDMRQVRTGLDLWGQMDDGDYHIKAYYNGTDRGTPGTTEWPSEDRQKDMNTFLQGTLRKNFSPVYTLYLSGKTSWDNIWYSSIWGDSRYEQTEFQLNSVHYFQIFRWWKLSFAADLQWDALVSTNYSATRLTAFSSLASSFRTNLFSADVAVDFSRVTDSGYCSRTNFSPSVDLRLKLSDGLNIIAFGRRAYRIPTFNELYYVGYGNPELDPEDAWLTDIGIDYNRAFNDSWMIKGKLDGFYNILNDKITSSPTPEDPAIWAPYNIGKVRSVGFDVVAGLVHKGDWNYSLDIKYSYQSAVDITPDSDTYGQQIPYIAQHVVVLTGNVGWKGWSLNPVWHLRAGRTDGMGGLPDWNTLGMTLAKVLDINRLGNLKLEISGYNLADCRYETVSGYPMPGRSIMCGVEYRF